MHKKINPIGRILIKHIYLVWDHNSLEKEFLEQEDGAVQYEDKE